MPENYPQYDSYQKRNFWQSHVEQWQHYHVRKFQSGSLNQLDQPP